MNQRIYRSHVDYYVWHGEGQCDNKTNDLREALHIRTDLIADGHSAAYILDSRGDEVDEDYIARLFVNVRLVSDTVSDPDDVGAASLYLFVPSNALEDHGARREERAEVALKVFHAHQGIEELSDFEIEVVDAFGRVVEPDTEYAGFGPDDGDVEQIAEPLTELLAPTKTDGKEAAAMGNLRRANQTLATALSEVAACLDGLGVAITFDSVHGDRVDWVTRARYVADVAMGRRTAYPDQQTLSEWVGLHYHRNFDAEPAEKRAEWADRYIEAHA